MIRALQRVPGVLLAEMKGTSALAIVAHDAAVSRASLVAAAARVGVNAAIVSNASAPIIGINAAQPLKAVRARRLAISAATVFVVLTSLNTFLPASTQTHWLLAVLLTTTWLLFFASMILRKKV
jgi:hypothetical protein